MKIKLTILIIALASLAYFGYPIIKTHYLSNGPKTITNGPAQQEPSSENVVANAPNAEGATKSSTIDATVLPSDCDNECKNFQNADALRYCRQVCGLPIVDQQGVVIQPATDCGSVSGLQKDYCLKDSAVKNKDFKACDQISDSGIKKTCKNRITEDIMESQGSL